MVMSHDGLVAFLAAVGGIVGLWWLANALIEAWSVRRRNPVDHDRLDVVARGGLLNDPGNGFRKGSR